MWTFFEAWVCLGELANCCMCAGCLASEKVCKGEYDWICLNVLGYACPSCPLPPYTFFFFFQFLFLIFFSRRSFGFGLYLGVMKTKILLRLK